jgi:hypothetical protein
VRPQLKLLRRPDVGRVPQQLLFIDAVAVLLPKAMPVQPGNFLQRRQRLAQPPEPALARVAFRARRRRTGKWRACCRCRPDQTSTWVVRPLASVTVVVASGVPCVAGSLPLKRGPSLRGPPRLPVRGGAARYSTWSQRARINWSIGKLAVARIHGTRL